MVDTCAAVTLEVFESRGEGADVAHKLRGLVLSMFVMSLASASDLEARMSRTRRSARRAKMSRMMSAVVLEGVLLDRGEGASEAAPIRVPFGLTRL